jgi:SAM-dependent methyltransferase
VTTLSRVIPTGQRRVERVAELVCDLSGESLKTARVLDLGCNTGGFSLELAKLGAAEVIGVEGRPENLADGIERRAAEGLDQVQFLTPEDVRAVTRERFGEFDVVLCLGILYHLDVPAVFEFAREVAAMCRGYALIETQVALSAKGTAEFEGREYAGRWYDEDTSKDGASLDNPRSFMPTKPSLLNLLADVGFSTVSEVLNPVIPPLAQFRDHTLLLATKGRVLHPHPDTDRWDERPGRIAHPAQGLRYRVLERLARRRGGGLPAVWR